MSARSTRVRLSTREDQAERGSWCGPRWSLGTMHDNDVIVFVIERSGGMARRGACGHSIMSQSVQHCEGRCAHMPLVDLVGARGAAQNVLVSCCASARAAPANGCRIGSPIEAASDRRVGYTWTPVTCVPSGYGVSKNDVSAFSRRHGCRMAAAHIYIGIRVWPIRH